MKTRILSALIGVPVLLGVLYCYRYFPLCIPVLCSVVSLACCIELLNAKKFFRHYALSVPCMLFSLIFPFLIKMYLVCTAVILFMIYLFVLIILANKTYKFDDIAYILTAVGFSSFGLNSLSYMTMYDETNSCFYIVLCLVIAWVSDGGAYFVGRSLGKRKLCPEISPKKTVEGAIGGVIIGVIGAVIDALVFEYMIFNERAHVNMITIVIVALVGSMLSIVGDLTFSLIKRSCNVKDYGNIIPGHGGLLDRCDSIIMVASFVYVAFLYFPLITYSH